MAKTYQQTEEEICEARLSQYEGRGNGPIGRGAFGNVYRVYSKEHDTHVVLKEVAWEDLNVPEGTSVDKIRSQIAREVTCMKESVHDHIIGFVESFAGRNIEQKLFPNGLPGRPGSKMEDGTDLKENAIKNAKQVLCIVMDLAEGGDLAKEIEKASAENPIAEERIWKWTVQITTALGYLHKNKVLHRDIKPANILLDANDDAIIADLGIAKQLTADIQLAETTVGTYYYMCPELLDDKPYDGRCDMWALGCMIHELMTRKKPFEGGFNPFVLFDNVKYVKPPLVPSKDYSWGLRNMCKCLLQKDPKYRPDAFNFYSYCLRNCDEYAVKGSDGIPFVRNESIPWSMEDLGDDEGKMELCAQRSLGITYEERKVQREAEEAACLATGTALTRPTEELFNKNRLFKLGRENSGGTTGMAGSPTDGSPGTPDSKACVVLVGKEHLEEEARHAAATKPKKKAPAVAMQAVKRAPQIRSKANPNHALPRTGAAAAGSVVKRPGSAAGKQAKQITDDANFASKARDHFDKQAKGPKKSLDNQIAEDLCRRIDAGELETYADICAYSLMAAKGAIRFDGANPWKEYNKEPDTADEQAELMAYIMPGEESVTFGALRVRRDLSDKFGMATPGTAATAPSAAN